MSHAIISKTREDYNLIARRFAATRTELWSELKQYEKLLKAGQQIMDWGCGNGRLLALLENKGIKYVGLDQSDELIKIAIETYQKQIKDGWVEFYCTAEEDKIFPKDYFDLVFMIASFHHLPDETSRLELLKKVYKEMKNGARLIMTNWNLESEWAKEKMKKKGWKVLDNNDYLIPWKNEHGEVECERYYHHFSENELFNLLTKVGLVVEEMYFTEKMKRGRNLITVAIKKAP